MMGTTLLAMGVLLLSDGLVYLSARQELRANLDTALLSVARAEVASALDRPGGSVHVHDEPALLSLPARSDYEMFAQIENSSDQIIARTENLRGGSPFRTDVHQEARARAGQITFSDITLRGARLRGIYYPTRDAHQRPLLAVIAVSQQPMQQALGTLRWVLALSLIGGCLLAAVGADRLARRLTGPLRRIALAARTMGVTDLNTRIPIFSTDRELWDVTMGLNEMLARLDGSFSSQQRFVSDASHELRSPLSNLRGTVEVALRRVRSAEEYQETLSVSLTEIERLSRLVAQLLTLTRADTDQYHLSWEVCDLEEIAAEAMAACAARAAEVGVFITVQSREPLPVNGDRDRLREVIDNLLDNGLRYAPRGSVLEIIHQKRDGMCCLTVRDVGPGLAQEEQEHVFDRFYRADPSRARQSGGLGLGLAIARAIVEAHHGHISVQSRLGQGAAFTTCIPASAAV